MGWLTFVDFANFRFMVEYFIAIAFMQPDIMESITVIIIIKPATTNTIATVVITIIVTITIIVVAIATMLIFPSPNSLLCI